jgi:DNA-binding response OmpR family regulator
MQGVLMSRVLVVDDEPELVNLLREFLTLKGYEVVTAADGPEALQVLKAERPHVVLLDIRLPPMNGLEVLRQLRTIDQEVRVIMITGVAGAETGRAALQLGATDYILKPIDLDYLERSLWHTVTPMTL